MLGTRAPWVGARSLLNHSAERLTVYQKYLYKLSLSWESERVIIGQVLPPVFAMINSPPLTRKSLLAPPIWKRLHSNVWLEISKNNPFSHCRCLLPKRTCSCTHKFTWGNPSRTSAASAASLLPTAPTSHSTWGSIWASSPTGVRSASASSPSCHTFSNTSGPTQGTSLTSAATQVFITTIKRTSESYSELFPRLHQGLLPAV